MNIEPSSVRITKCCGASFLLRRAGKDRCSNCDKPNPEMWTPWYDESGDMQFELISDVREKA